ncbi:MAG TPA: protein kinase [Gammaproteobacteria bacterium]|nr:protein kinase [Gammaproteobacteria bacterium]
MNLGTRLFIINTLLIALAVGASIAVTYVLGRNAVDKEVQNILVTTQSVQQFFLQRELRELELISTLVASDRAFVAYVSQALSSGPDDVIDTRSIADLLNARSDEYGFDFALVLDLQGRVLVDTGQVRQAGRDLSNQPVVAGVIETLGINSGVWLKDDKVLLVAVVPLVRGRTVEGFVVTGSQVGTELLNGIARISRTDLAYVSLESNQSDIVATTLPLAISEILGSKLNQTATLSRFEKAGSLTEPWQLTLGDQPWVARITSISREDRQSFLVSLVPQASLFATFRSIVNALIVGGIIAIVLALIVSVITSRRFLRPMERLTAMADDAARGEFPQKIDAGGSGEIARLRQAFNRLITDLREQRAVDTYFASLWQQRAVRKPAFEAKADDGDTLAIGTVLGNRYELTRLVGKGGTGIVYEARDRELNETVALKMLKKELLRDAENIKRLKDEISLARRITHPNVVRTYDFGQVDGMPLISMEYVRGTTLQVALEKTGRVTYYAALRLAREIAAGLNAAHKAGVLHRDMKAGNVIINNNAKVMDFGIAQPASQSDASQHNKTFEGTPTYLAPEQVQGQPADERSDIYSLGVLLMLMFTGRAPFTGSDPQQIAAARLNKDPIKPSTIWREIPTELERLILRCLEKEPGDRYQTVEELLDDLEHCRTVGF